MHGPNDFDPENQDPMELPVDGTLDLHTFHPREAGDLVREYLAACRERGILEVRIVHGKGTGVLRRTVHAVLERMAEVEGFRLAGEDRGSWGATLVVLRPLPGSHEPGSGSPDPSQSRGTR